MLLTLTIFANLKQLSPSYRKAAADLGAGPVQTFLHVVLPLTLPGIMVGAFLTFVLAIGDYITPQILGGNNEVLMPQLIMMQIGRRGDFPLASALSLVLMAVVTLAYVACARMAEDRAGLRGAGISSGRLASMRIDLSPSSFCRSRRWSCSRCRRRRFQSRPSPVRRCAGTRRSSAMRG